MWVRVTSTKLLTLIQKNLDKKIDIPLLRLLKISLAVLSGFVLHFKKLRMALEIKDFFGCLRFILIVLSLCLLNFQYFSDDGVIEFNEWMYVNEILDSLSDHFDTTEK